MIPVVNKSTLSEPSDPRNPIIFESLDLSFGDISIVDNVLEDRTALQVCYTS